MVQYTTLCANCREELEFDDEFKVGMMVQCNLCQTYMQILALETVDGTPKKVNVAARRVSLHEARALGYA